MTHLPLIENFPPKSNDQLEATDRILMTPQLINGEAKIELFANK